MVARRAQSGAKSGSVTVGGGARRTETRFGGRDAIVKGTWRVASMARIIVAVAVSGAISRTWLGASRGFQARMGPKIGPSRLTFNGPMA